VAAVPDPVDLAIVFVPAREVPEVVAACGARGIRAVMIESGGFAESGAEGRRLQARTAEAAGAAGVRLWGPNCMGLVDAAARHVFSFVSPAIWEAGLTPGGVSLVVQSGMLSGAFLMDVMTRDGLGVGKVCSIGNKMDVDESDLLEYLLADPQTAVVGLYLEGLGRGRRFLELCRGSAKPVVVLKGGVSRQGARAALSHTASLAGDGAVLAGALAQAGVRQVRDFQELTDAARTLAAYPGYPRGGGGRVAVLTYSGGAGIVSADWLAACGLTLAELGAETRRALQAVFPEWMPVGHPVDLWPAVELRGPEEAFGAALTAVGADPGVDLLLLHVVAGSPRLSPDLPGLARTARAAGKPLFVWAIGRAEAALAFQQAAREAGVPAFREIGRAVTCLAALAAGEAPAGPAPGESAVIAPPRLPEDLARLVAGAAGPLDEHDSKRLLSAWGMPVAAERVVADPAALKAAGSALGWPLVLKGLAPGDVHKTEAGLVRLGLSGPKAAAAAWAELAAALGGTGRILAQTQVRGTLELMAGFLRDPQLGPCVMVGLGGVFAEALEDRAFAVAPLGCGEALALIRRLRGQRLLDGFRGAAPLDREALAGILMALGELGRACPRIREIDVNPLIVVQGRPVAVDAVVVMD
jgi:acetyltransferase